ncbi:hypothetical protein [Spirosoma fluminis]
MKTYKVSTDEFIGWPIDEILKYLWGMQSPHELASPAKYKRYRLPRKQYHQFEGKVMSSAMWSGPEQALTFRDIQVEAVSQEDEVQLTIQEYTDPLLLLAD